MQVTIKEVISKSDLKKFIKFPHKLYKDNKQYVPQLDSQEYKILTQSPSLEYCTIKKWMAYSPDGEIIGRIAAILNPRANECHSYKRLRFGWFDFIDDKDVAKALMNTAEEWGRSMGLTEIHGPLGYNTWNRQGMMIEGFENTPPVNCLYNYPYYPTFMDDMGFVKEVDWIQVRLEISQGVPDKLVRIHDLLLEKYGLSYLEVKNLKDRKDLIKSFFEGYNESFKAVDNFIPLTEKEIDDIVKNYFPLLRQELSCFIMDKDNNVAAFSVCFPSMSKAFQKAKGKLFPFGWYHLYKAFNNYDTIDFMMSGAFPEWQSKGLSSMYHTYMDRSLKGREVKYGITNPQGDTNSAYKVWGRYTFEPYMRRRCYIKPL